MAEDRVAGTVRNVGGKVQEGVGRLTGDGKTQAEGKVNQVLGSVEDLYGQAKDSAVQTADTMKAGASDAADYVATLVKDRPYTVAVGAFFLGWLVAHIGSSRHERGRGW